MVNGVRPTDWPTNSQPTKPQSNHRGICIWLIHQHSSLVYRYIIWESPHLTSPRLTSPSPYLTSPWITSDSTTVSPIQKTTQQRGYYGTIATMPAPIEGGRTSPIIAYWSGTTKEQFTKVSHNFELQPISLVGMLSSGSGWDSSSFLPSILFFSYLFVVSLWMNCLEFSQSQSRSRLHLHPHSRYHCHHHHPPYHPKHYYYHKHNQTHQHNQTR